MPSSSKKRKQFLEKIKRGCGTREGFYDIYGENAYADVVVKKNNYLKYKNNYLKYYDIQRLIMWVLAEGSDPQWIFVKNKPLVEKIIVVIIDGLNINLFRHHRKRMSFLVNLVENKALNGPYPLETPLSLFTSHGAIQGFLNMRQKKKKKKYDKSSTTKKKHAEYYILTKHELITNKYPINKHGFIITKGAKENSIIQKPKKNSNAPSDTSNCNDKKNDKHNINITNRKRKKKRVVYASKNSFSILSNDDDEIEMEKNENTEQTYEDTSPTNVNPPMFALDCEMCFTKKGLELTRCTIVNEDKKVVYDQLCKPSNPITDYNTRYSGISEKDLENITTTLEDVQKKFLSIVTSDCILIGHSLENDLNALKISHKKCIDTALLYPHPAGPPRKSALRFLTRKYLKKIIQNQDSAIGHDSVEDAIAAMELVQLKIKEGPSFGVEIGQTENIIKLLSRLRRKMCMTASPEVLKKFAIGEVNALPYRSDAQKVAKIKPSLKKRNDLLIIHMEDLLRTFHDTSDPEAIGNTIEKTSNLLSELYDASLKNTMFIIMSGQSDSKQIKKVQEEMIKSQTYKQKNEQYFKSLMVEAKTGALFVGIKKE